MIIHPRAIKTIMIPVTVEEQLRALKILDPASREAILEAARETPENPVAPPELIPMWKGQRPYKTALGKLDRLTPEARKALDALQTSLRLPLLLQLDGKTQDEIVAELRLTKYAVNARQNRAKRAIQAALWGGGQRLSWNHDHPNVVRFSEEELRDVAHLSKRLRQSLSLWLAGKSVAEIAATRGVARHKVQSDLTTAKRTLRGKLWLTQKPQSACKAFSGGCARNRGSDISEAERKAIDLLPPRQRTALLLQLDGKLTTQIAEHMGISRAVVHDSLKKAKRKVRAVLATQPAGHAE